MFSSKIVLSGYAQQLRSKSKPGKYKVSKAKRDAFQLHQYLDGLESKQQINLHCDGVWIEYSSALSLFLFLAMKHGIDVKSIEPYELEPKNEEPSFWRRWGTYLYPDIKPSDWIFL